MSPRRSNPIPTADGFAPESWNLVLYKFGITPERFHEDDDLLIRSEGHADSGAPLPNIGEPIPKSWMPHDAHPRFFIDPDGEFLDPNITWGDLRVLDRIPEARQARVGSIYGVLHVFVHLPAHPETNSGIRP